MLPYYLDLTSEDDSYLGVEFLRAGHAMNSNQMYEFQQIESDKGIFKNNFGILHTKHFCFLCIVAKIMPQYISKVKHYLVGYGVVKPNGQKLHFCVAYFLKTCIEVLCFHWFTVLMFSTVNAALARPDLQSFPPHNYHLLCWPFQTPRGQFPATEGYTEILRRTFKFANQPPNAAIEIIFDRRLPGGWLLALQSGSKVVIVVVACIAFRPHDTIICYFTYIKFKSVKWMYAKYV